MSIVLFTHSEAFLTSSSTVGKVLSSSWKNSLNCSFEIMPKCVAAFIHLSVRERYPGSFRIELYTNKSQHGSEELRRSSHATGS